MICNGDKYELGGQPGETIGLPLDLQGLLETVEIEGNTLLLKADFHCTLVAVGQIIKKHNVDTSNFIEKVVNDFCEFIESNDISLIKYSDEYRFVEHNDRMSLVVMCDVSNLDKFFDLINEKYQLNIEYPPTHVTLYTLQPNKGVFLTNSDEINNLTKVVSKPSGISLQN